MLLESSLCRRYRGGHSSVQACQALWENQWSRSSCCSLYPGEIHFICLHRKPCKIFIRCYAQFFSLWKMFLIYIIIWKHRFSSAALHIITKNWFLCLRKIFINIVFSIFKTQKVKDWLKEMIWWVFFKQNILCCNCKLLFLFFIYRKVIFRGSFRRKWVSFCAPKSQILYFYH